MDGEYFGGRVCVRVCVCVWGRLPTAPAGHASHVAVYEDNSPTDRKRLDCAETVAATFAMLRSAERPPPSSSRHAPNALSKP